LTRKVLPAAVLALSTESRLNRHGQGLYRLPSLRAARSSSWEIAAPMAAVPWRTRKVDCDRLRAGGRQGQRWRYRRFRSPITVTEMAGGVERSSTNFAEELRIANPPRWSR